MNSGLTSEFVAILTAPFAPEDHEFNRGFIYISEEAICQRIELVDPSWEWRVETMTYENDMATVIGILSICGVVRYGTGQQLAQIDKNGKESVGESRKGATTDALKRAARLFGIGRYLLQCPKDVKGNGPELNKWLASLGKKSAPQAETPAPQRSAASPVAPKDQFQDRGIVEEFVKAWAANGATIADIQAALKVVKLSEWTGGLKSAHEAVRAYMAKLIPDADAQRQASKEAN